MALGATVTLLAVGNWEGERRCDERCYNAVGPHCDCCCEGINHGKGLAVASNNMARVAEAWLDEIRLAHQAAGAPCPKIVVNLQGQLL